MCFICHNKVAGVFAVALIQLTTTLSTLTTVTTPTAPIIPKWLLRLLLLKMFLSKKMANDNNLQKETD